jgi:hypothetical protein
VSSWTSVADASGIAAVATSAVAVIAVLPLVVRQILSAHARRSPTPASPQPETYASPAPSREGEEAPVVIEIVNYGETTAHLTYRIKLSSAGGQGKTAFAKWLLQHEREPALRLQSRSLAWSDVLRDTARGLEEQADIIAAEASGEAPSEG